MNQYGRGRGDIVVSLYRLVLGLLCPAVILAQTATLQGIVTDPSGAPVPGASITAVLESTGAVRQASTDSDGSYRLPGLAVGIYTLRCESPGFKH
jgi:protocatechuate 3,4-dioxygenase beta subunit